VDTKRPGSPLLFPEAAEETVVESRAQVMEKRRSLSHLPRGQQEHVWGGWQAESVAEDSLLSWLLFWWRK
jgi:hypothetical protein